MSLLRLLARLFAALVALLVVAAGAVVLHGRHRHERHVARAAVAPAVAADSSLVARGAHISAFLCASCHASDDLEVLSGGRENFADIPGGPHLGTIVAPNLTPGGVAGRMSDGELARAIREGLGHDGRPLIVMPSAGLRRLSDRDLAAVIAFLRRQPAVAHATPPRRLNLLGDLVLGLHVFDPSDQPAVAGPVAAVAHEASASHGEYLTAIADCRTCHGPDLRGGRQGQLPPVGPDLVAFARAQPLAAFSGALRQGIHPNGGALDPARMPWLTYAHFDDVETEAIWRSLRERP